MTLRKPAAAPLACHEPVRSAREVSVVIPTRNTRELVLACLDSLRGAAFGQVVLVDDGSVDGTSEAVRTRFPAVEVISSAGPEGFAGAANRGAEAARDMPLLLFLNSDTELLPSAVDHLLAAFDRNPRLGIAGARLYYPDGTPQWSGGRAPTLFWLFGLASGLPRLLRNSALYRWLRPVPGFEGGRVDWVTGAAMAMRAEVWARAGPFDESYAFYGQDLDLCLRAQRAGWSVATVPGFDVVHHQGSTIGQGGGAVDGARPELLWRDLLRWAERHRGPEWARLARVALRAGGWLRTGIGWASSPFLTPGRREARRAELGVFRQALRRLRERPHPNHRGE